MIVHRFARIGAYSDPASPVAGLSVLRFAPLWNQSDGSDHDRGLNESDGVTPHAGSPSLEGCDLVNRKQVHFEGCKRRSISGAATGGSEPRSMGIVTWALLHDSLVQPGKADIHAVVDRGVVVFEFLVVMADLQ